MSFLSQRPRRPVPAAYRKWNKGERPIGTFGELVALMEGGFYIFDGERSAGYHPSVIDSWQFRTIRQRLKFGKLFPGVRNLAIPYVFEAVWHQVTKGVDPGLSRYFVVCHDLRTRFESKSRSHIMARCRSIVRSHTAGAGKCEVKFNDDDRP